MNILDVLLPKEGKFFTLLESQAQYLADATKVLKTFLTQLESLNEDEVKKRMWLIRDLVNHAAEVETTLIDELHKTFITPLDREDIHLLTSRLTAILDGLNSAARTIGISHLKKAPSRVCQFAEMIVVGATEIQNLLSLLRQKKIPYASIERIHHVLSQADDLYYEAMADVFAKDDNPVKLLRLKDLYESLEHVISAIGFVSKTVRGIAVKQG